MSPISQFVPALLAFAGLIQGATIPFSRAASSNLEPRQACENGPDSRNCWTDGFDINTNPHESWPSTGQTETFNLRLTNTTCNPDGHGEKWCTLINGQYPGPTIRANWGDNIRIIVHNDVMDNGTSIHWHGLRQLNSNKQDGTNGVTECPLAPGTTRTYEFKATQHGTTWYHSHHSAQYGEGVVGTIIIDGPANTNYNTDLGVLPLSDWYYDQTWMLLWRALYGGGLPPPSDTVLVNGTMIDGNGNGQYQKINVVKGQRYRLRFVNTAVDHLFHVSMDGHPFTVIEADYVPVVPYETTDLKINIGQRYDVVFTADQDGPASNYWLRVQPGSALCGKADIYNNADVTVGAILSYEGAPDENPTSTGSTMTDTCDDETFKPFLPLPVPSDTFLEQVTPLDITLGSGAENIVNWYINGSSMDVNWEEPTISYVKNGTPYDTRMSVVEMPEKDTWYFWVIRNDPTRPLPHPIHLHGHDFWLLGSGVGAFPYTLDSFNFKDAVRRDVATLPGSPDGAWMLLAFQSDNPGAWLMHCHIAWHASQGLSMQFVERKDEILSTIGNLDDYNQGCIEWKRYWNSPDRVGVDEDSGLFAPGKLLPDAISGPGAGV
ncbi:laccase precursor [Eremomyces bilateralis CBS 781.70]|uniref:laccase n=1 Tax=Eremomyces bilateralis CBS 781.70 TaxID=1392243 RepID=A0A6G1GI07_9PEZI|nr:laccase precursor [Eremomyces bilateralis CBS 781.70]KAF1817586.1 laccase precursor [Eremomyces bilateralis CBS 781.70]